MEVKAVIGKERSGGTNRIVSYVILADGVEVFTGAVTEDGLTTDEVILERVQQEADLRAQQVLGVKQAVAEQRLEGREIALPVTMAAVGTMADGKATLAATPEKEG